MDMREAVIREVNSALAEVGIPKGWQWDVFEVVKITDRILAVPEIADALRMKHGETLVTVNPAWPNPQS